MCECESADNSVRARVQVLRVCVCWVQPNSVKAWVGGEGASAKAKASAGGPGGASKPEGNENPKPITFECRQKRGDAEKTREGHGRAGHGREGSVGVSVERQRCTDRSTEHRA